MYSCRVSGYVCYYRVVNVDIAKFVLLIGWLTASEDSLEFHFRPFYTVCIYIIMCDTHTQKCESCSQQNTECHDAYSYCRINHPFHSICGATAPPGPWPPSYDAPSYLYFQLFSSILLLPAVVMHPSGPHPPIWFLVFPLVLWCRSFCLKPFF